MMNQLQTLQLADKSSIPMKFLATVAPLRVGRMNFLEVGLFLDPGRKLNRTAEAVTLRVF